jgi:hypothetical protein
MKSDKINRKIIKGIKKCRKITKNIWKRNFVVLKQYEELDLI